MSEARKPRHTVVVVLESGAIGARMQCPYEGQTFGSWMVAPECRQVGGDPSGGVAESCHAVEGWEYQGEDSLTVPGPLGDPVEVASLPIEVDVRWDADGEFLVSPVRDTAEDDAGDCCDVPIGIGARHDCAPLTGTVEDVKAGTPITDLRAERDQLAAELAELKRTDKPWSDAVDWLLNAPIDPEDLLKFNCIADRLVTTKELHEQTVSVTELYRRDALFSEADEAEQTRLRALWAAGGDTR